MTASILKKVFQNLIDSLFYTYFGLRTTLNGKYSKETPGDIEVKCRLQSVEQAKGLRE